MKKLLLALILFSVLALVYGQEASLSNHFDFGLTCLVAVSDGIIAPGPGLVAGWYNTDFFGAFGFGSYINIVIPIVEGNLGAAVSLLAGPSYMIYDNGIIALPITAGFHFDLVSDFRTVKINIGIGTNIDLIWRFGQKWYGYGRLLAAYNFGAGGEFLTFPGLGIGFSF